MDKRKTLVIISPGFPADEADSTCIPSQQLFVRALKAQQPELDLVILSFQYPFKAANYMWHGIPVIALSGKNRGKFYRLLIWLKAWLALKKLNRECNLTGLISFWLGDCAFIGSRFAKRHGLKHYSWILGQDARPGNRYVNRIRPQAQWLIGLSDSLSKEFETNYHIKPKYVIPLGTDITGFGAPAASRDIDIMGGGSLIPLKRFNLFVDAVKDLSLQFPDIKAVICGAGREMENLKAQINQLDMQNNIELKGEITHRETLALMQRSRLFLHTSAYEGFGTVLCEGLYSGAHVISLVSPMNDMPEQFHKAENVKDMVEIATKLLKDNNLRNDPVLIYPVAGIAEQIAALFD